MNGLKPRRPSRIPTPIPRKLAISRALLKNPTYLTLAGIQRMSSSSTNRSVALVRNSRVREPASGPTAASGRRGSARRAVIGRRLSPGSAPIDVRPPRPATVVPAGYRMSWAMLLIDTRTDQPGARHERIDRYRHPPDVLDRARSRTCAIGCVLAFVAPPERPSARAPHDLRLPDARARPRHGVCPRLSPCKL